MTGALLRLVAGLVAVGCAAAVWAEVTGGWFYGDDFIHLIEVINYRLADVVWRPFLGHLYVVPNLVYYAVWRWCGARPACFYGVGLGVHLLNVALFFGVVLRLTANRRLACLAATVWGVLPLHEGTVGWFAVHGQALVGTAALYVICGLVAAVVVGRRVGGWRALGWTLALAVGSMCFGTGVATAFVLPAVALVVLPWARRTPAATAVLLAGPAGVTGVYLATHLLVADTFDGRLPLRFVRSALEVPGEIASMWGHLVAYGVSVTLAGAWWRAPFPYPSLLAVVLGGVFALAVAAAVRREPAERRLLLLGFVTLALVTFALIALGRALAYTVHYRVVASEAAQTLRYHYVGSIGIGLAAVMVVQRLGAGPASGARGAFASAAVLGLLAAAWAASAHRIDHHDDHRAATERVLARVTGAALMGLGGITRVRDQAFLPLFIPPERGVTTAGIWTIFYPDPPLRFRHLRFESTDERLLARVSPGSPLAAVLVPAPPPPAPRSSPRARLDGARPRRVRRGACPPSSSTPTPTWSRARPSSASASRAGRRRSRSRPGASC